MEHLQVGKVIVKKVKGEWTPGRLTGCRTTKDGERIWRCCRSYHKGVQEYEHTIKLEQHD